MLCEVNILVRTGYRACSSNELGSRKSLDGSVDSKGSTPVSKSIPIEEALLGYLNKQAKEDDVVERASEEVVERKIFS